MITVNVKCLLLWLSYFHRTETGVLTITGVQTDQDFGYNVRDVTWWGVSVPSPVEGIPRGKGRLYGQWVISIWSWVPDGRSGSVVGDRRHRRDTTHVCILSCPSPFDLSTVSFKYCHIPFVLFTFSTLPSYPPSDSPNIPNKTYTCSLLTDHYRCYPERVSTFSAKWFPLSFVMNPV